MKLILITGTTNGIGNSLKNYFLSRGYRVIGLDKEKDEEGQDDNFEFIHLDLADKEAIEKIKDVVGKRSLYAIINNAGEYEGNSFEDFNIDRFSRSQLVNSTMPLAITAAMASNLEDGISNVINITSSDACFAGHEDLGYSASKAALSNVTKSMAAYLGKRNIRVNAIAPGWVDTSMADSAGINDLAYKKTPLGRNAKPQEIVDLIEYLISDRASFINGSIINIDGGYSMIDTVVQEEYERSKEK